jgi:para-aminobenzoate synthetase
MGVCATEGLAAIACDLALGQMTEWHALAGAITSQTVTMPSDGFMAYMERCLQSRRCAPDPTLPCGLCGGGLVGYLGYEMRRECGLSDALSSVPPSRASEPDAAFLVVDRYVAIDHVTNMVYGVALVDNAGTDDGDSAGAWFAHTEQTLAFVAERAAKHSASQSSASLSWTGTTAKLAAPGVTFSLDRGRERYVRDIASCLGEIADGESYELCLTNKARASAGAICDAWAYYLRLRSTNPAPYAAFVTFGRGLPVVASSSPEKFISIDREGRARSKPIKGTAPRGATPAEDRALAADLAACPKTFAENLMIVDLVRNDLSVCCVPGSVGVPSGRLMAIESYAAVHQMVTTVDGLLESGTTALDAVRAAFPPGSMTGAPKKRSVDILDRLEEGRPRGIYSGALGYFSADGACCLSVVIRTAVIDDGGSASIGCGGAIVADSEPDAEFSEILLKADRLVRAAGATEPIQVDTRPERVLVETMRLDPECALVEEHIARAIQSAEALGSRTLTPDAVRDGIRKEVHNNLGTANATPVRLRISIDLDTGCVTSTATALAVGPRWHTPNDALRAGVGDRVARVAFSSPVDSADVRLAHKTAARVVYDRAHQQTWSVDDDNNNVPSDARETLLINEKGHVTEATRASIALVPTDGSLPVTPPLDDGVLPGVMRARLLARGLIREGVITLDDLAVAAAAGRPLLLFNAVRGVYAVRI